MLSNYCMNPLELFEIDNPGKKNQVLKSHAKVPPSMSCYLIQLDMTDEN